MTRATESCYSVDRRELSMGPFCVTRSNPTHQLTDPTQHIITRGKILTHPTTTKFNCLIQPNLIWPCFKCINIILSEFKYFCYSGPNPTHSKLKISTQPDPNQPNPTNPMTQPNPWTTLYKTELDDHCYKPAVNCRRWCQLSWLTAAQFITLWAFSWVDNTFRRSICRAKKVLEESALVFCRYLNFLTGRKKPLF